MHSNVVNLRKCFVSFLCLLVSPWAMAQELDQMKNFDEYNVFYNLVNSTFLTPEIAERYEVPRDEDVAVLTISVRAPNNQGEMTDQPSEVTGSATDLVRRYPLDFDEFQDPHAVYYIAEVPAQGRTTLDFSLDIKPKDSAETFELEFSEEIFPPAPINR